MGYDRRDRLFHQAREASNPQGLVGDITQLDLNLGIRPSLKRLGPLGWLEGRLVVEATLPLVMKSLAMSYVGDLPLHGEGSFASVRGLTDMTLTTRWDLFRVPDRLALTVGMVVPTGQISNGPLAVVGGLVLQAGNGTVDPLFGLDGRWPIGRHGFLVGFAQTRLSLYANSHGFRASNLLLGGLGGGLLFRPLWLGPRGALSPGLRVDVLEMGQAYSGIAPISDTGGTWLLLAPNLGIDQGPVRVELVVRFPVFQTVNDVQLASRFDLSVLVRWRFR